MQTQLAFFFVLHVVGLGFLAAFFGWQLRASRLLLVFAYLCCFYAAWGRLLQANPSLWLPNTAERTGSP